MKDERLNDERGEGERNEKEDDCVQGKGGGGGRRGRGGVKYINKN